MINFTDHVYFSLNIHSGVFHMEPKTHAGHMKAVKNLILEGTSKWSAKILITGNSSPNSHFELSEDCSYLILFVIFFAFSMLESSTLKLFTDVMSKYLINLSYKYTMYYL